MRGRRRMRHTAISIHAPPRGATLSVKGQNGGIAISIHAPPRGATEKSPVAMPCTNFNSRPSARGDSAFPAWCPPCVISIHAPPRGATIPAHRLCTSHKNFNSRPSARGDLTAPLLSSVSTHFNSRPSARGDPRLMMAGWYPAEFQFTPLREGRRAWAPALHRRADFNSRPSARGDFCGFPTTFALQISIHAPPRGATSSGGLSYGLPPISIHAPPRGATPVAGNRRGFKSNFNSRPSARGD